MYKTYYFNQLRNKGYRIHNDLTFFETPHGTRIERIVQISFKHFGLMPLFDPEYGPGYTPCFKLKTAGIQKANSYINELIAKRKEILDAGKDTADDTPIPSIEDIESDINFQGIDDEGKYYNGWGVTDNYDADRPLCLIIGEDFETIYEI